MAWAMVTDGGTPYSRQPRWAPGTAAAMNCAVVSVGDDTGAAVAPLHSVRVGEITYACET